MSECACPPACLSVLWHENCVMAAELCAVLCMPCRSQGANPSVAGCLVAWLTQHLSTVQACPDSLHNPSAGWMQSISMDPLISKAPLCQAMFCMTDHRCQPPHCDLHSCQGVLLLLFLAIRKCAALAHQFHNMCRGPRLPAGVPAPGRAAGGARRRALPGADRDCGATRARRHHGLAAPEIQCTPVRACSAWGACAVASA